MLLNVFKFLNFLIQRSVWGMEETGIFPVECVVQMCIRYDILGLLNSVLLKKCLYMALIR